MGYKTKVTTIKPHHKKPYRKRHLSGFTISFLLFIFTMLQLGVLQGINRPVAESTPVHNAATDSSTYVSSSYGFVFSVDTNTFAISATQPDGNEHPQLGSNGPLNSVSLKPLAGNVERVEAAAEASIEVGAEAAVPQATTDFTVKTLSSHPDSIGGAQALKTVYQFTPTFPGGTTYSIVWSGVTKGQPFSVTIQGLIGSPTTPTSFKQFFDTLTIASSAQVKGAAIDFGSPKAAADPAKLDAKYLSDALSPAVVKIYHIVCGALTINGQVLTTDTCSGFTGSGFLATSNGYIATNGHVVVYDAHDALVDILTKNPSVLTAYLSSIGLSGDQIAQLNNDPVTLASVIAKIYDIPDKNLNFTNDKDLLLVATGSTPPNFSQLATSTDISRYQHDSGEFKNAKIVGYNYAAKDKLIAIADPTKGFSSSDVALLKIDVDQAPTIAISDEKVTQNQKILLIGFPGDADNQLTDNSQIGVSVTDGVISSIRQAAGKNGLLYQSDADASHGNSGGPAIDETGRVIGLLTYRASGDSSGNAAKSYIRDIHDFNDLTAKLHVSINSSSHTQVLWQQGLQLYAQRHYKAALKNFNAVQNAYPSQRLVADYITSTQSSIDAGKNVKQLPLTLLVAGIVISFIGTALFVGLIIRHHGHHQIYKATKNGTIE